MHTDLYNECAGKCLVQATMFWKGKRIRLSCAKWDCAIEDMVSHIGARKLARSQDFEENGILTYLAEISLKSGTTIEFEFHYFRSDKNGEIRLVKKDDDMKFELI